MGHAPANHCKVCKDLENSGKRLRADAPLAPAPLVEGHATDRLSAFQADFEVSLSHEWTRTRTMEAMPPVGVDYGADLKGILLPGQDFQQPLAHEAGGAADQAASAARSPWGH